MALEALKPTGMSKYGRLVIEEDEEGEQIKFQGLGWIERTGCVVSCSSSGNSYNISWEAPLDDPVKQRMLKVKEPLSLLMT
ncbi:hypothetical protein HN51_041010 [Arachis hypogaea]